MNELQKPIKKVNKMNVNISNIPKTININKLIVAIDSTLTSIGVDLKDCNITYTKVKRVKL